MNADISSAPMTLCLGITGHRPAKLVNTDLSDLSKKIASMLNDLYEAAGRLVSNANSVTAPRVRIISALAEGVDRLAVDTELLDLIFQFELQAVLPFPQRIYEIDFSPGNSQSNPEQGSVDEFQHFLTRAGLGTTDNRIVELAGNPESAKDAYYACGEYIVRHSDFLLAVWDETEKTMGRGGTADVMDMAVNAETPVFCISPNAPYTITVLTEPRHSPKIDEHTPLFYSKDLLDTLLVDQLRLRKSNDQTIHKEGIDRKS